MTKSGEHFCIRVNPEPQGQLKSSEGLKGACIAPYTALLKAPLKMFAYKWITHELKATQESMGCAKNFPMKCFVFV